MSLRGAFLVSVLSLCPRIWVRAELLLFEWKPNIGELLGSLGYGKSCVVESCWQDYWRWKQGCIIGDEILESNYWRDIIGCHLLETISWRLGCGFGNMHEYGSNFQGHHLIFPRSHIANQRAWCLVEIWPILWDSTLLFGTWNSFAACYLPRKEPAATHPKHGHDTDKQRLDIQHVC